jgi:hypothetical protein
MRPLAAIAGLVVLVAVRTAAAEPPPLDHVVTAPTAWLPHAGSVLVTAGLDQRGASELDLGYGLGGIAAVDVGFDHDLRACDACGDARPSTILLGRAGFRAGVHQDRLFAGQPAIVLGWRATFAGARGARASDMYLVASRVLGGFRLHAGVDAIDARADDHVNEPRLGATIRPTAGVELTVAQYPRTTMMADATWVPLENPGAPTVEALYGLGVRYQSFKWGGVELAVRVRGGEGLADTTVMARVAGVWER